MKDYALEPPGKSGYENALRALMRECKRVRFSGPGPDEWQLVDTEFVENMTVEDFVSLLSQLPSTQRPVRDLVVSSHANSTRWPLSMEIDLDAENVDEWVSNTTPEELQLAIESGTVHVPPGVASDDSMLLLLGCRIGQDWTFLDLFRQALGGDLPVRAPNFFHFLWPVPGGVFEWFLYGFSIIRIDEKGFENWIDLQRAFRAERFLLINGDRVPEGMWTTSWIPLEGWNTNFLTPTGVQVSLGESVANRRTLSAINWFFHVKDRFTRLESVSGAIPPSHESRLQLLYDSLSRDPRFQAGYFYPVYRQKGFISLEEFMQGYYWWCQPQRTQNRLCYRGTRHIYTAAPVVRDPNSGTLIFNFYPKKGSNEQPRIHFSYSDERYFTTVRPQP